jgi:hypothetical protein
MQNDQLLINFCIIKTLMSIFLQFVGKRYKYTANGHYYHTHVSHKCDNNGSECFKIDR